MSGTFWEAPQARGPVFGSVTLPGSKSLSARELLLSAIGDTYSRLDGVLYARDTDLMVAGLRSLGAVVEPWPPVLDQPVQITPVSPLSPVSSSNSIVSPVVSLDIAPVTVDCGLAGTVARFLPVLAAILGRPARFIADGVANQRPLRPLLQSLEEMGASIEFESPEGNIFPFTVFPPQGKIPSEISIDATSSSQFVSALLLAAPLFPQTCTIRSKTVEVPSHPHIQMTLECLSKRGINALEHVDPEGKPYWTVEPASVFGQDVPIEPDLSNAGPFLALAGIAGGRISIPAWPARTNQAGNAWRTILADFGMQVEWNHGVLSATGDGTLRAIDADFTEIGELVPTVAALAAFAEGTSRLRGLHHLRGHETDRLQALETELSKLGIGCEITAEDDLLITGKSPQWDTLNPEASRPRVEMCAYGDHRMATFAALLGLYYPVQIDDIGATAKTLPDFATMWQRLLGVGD